MTADPQVAATPKRKWYQFSLRGLLILMVIVSAVMAAGLRWIAPAQRQRATVKMVERLGGSVRYADAPADETWVVLKLRDWLPRDYFDAVTRVSLDSNPLGSPILLQEADLIQLCAFPQLQRLDLHNTRITDSGMAALEGLTELQWLSLGFTQITDTGLVHLRGLTRLQRLELGDTAITDVGLTHLESLTQLQWLGLDGTKITDAGLVHLKRHLQARNILFYNTRVTEAGAAELQLALPNCRVWQNSILAQ